MRTRTIYLAGIVSGVLLTVLLGGLFHSFDHKFWLGARNGFFVGMGIVFTSSVLSYFVGVVDAASQSLRKGE